MRPRWAGISWLLRLLCFLRLLLLLCLLKLIWKVRVDLGLPDHIWVDKRAAIAKKVDDLCDQFIQPWELDGWLTSRRPILPMLFSMVLRLDRENWLWEMMSIWNLALLWYHSFSMISLYITFLSQYIIKYHMQYHMYDIIDMILHMISKSKLWYHRYFEVDKYHMI